MNTPVNPTDQVLARLREEFQGHRIWRATCPDGKLGAWVATLHDLKAGVEATVVRNNAQELHEALTVELNRASINPESNPTKWVRW
ncbi:hypothetical protein ACFOY4_35735 [Actinomadura syzygii]|uniref:Uncharacterized protein n=1 Tax=Actinomadura syzygii TaxID=1427538 RepID=A0A5D0TRT0_9ACTN|nr:hypothetical protein [Actinomadura syzygii]TYC08878.1 hypothetical protein FXF65_35685 [Actinomadura syzygii]